MHDENSLLDSCTKFYQYLDKAIELGQKSICITNHGNVHNWIEKKILCDEKGIKFIFGVEAYLTERLCNDDGTKTRDNYHTVLIAKNQSGIDEINRLLFLASHKDHKYYKNRITFDEFLGISDNVIKISACVQSPLYKFMLKSKESGDNEEKDTLDRLLKKYDYYEIQYHNFEQQKEFNRYLYDMSKKYNKPLIAGTDTHSLNNYMAECRKILQIGKDAEFSPEDECDMTYKTYDELVNAFKEQDSLPLDVVLEAIENTNVLSDSIEDIVIDKSIKYPLLTDDDERTMWEVLNRKHDEKVKNGIIDDNPKYRENINEEMRVFKKVNMIGFMLGMSNILSWCRENNIPTSPCRGSVGGSTVAYISDITDVDPVKRKTVFSRFCNEDREEVGDVDVDFYEDQRPLVYDYIINKFGAEKTAFILAHGTCVDKGTIDIICKALRKLDERQGKPIRYSLEDAKQVKKLYEENPEKARKLYSDVFYYFDGLINTKVSQSQHPAGIVASPVALIEPYGVFLGEDSQRILCINMEEVHEIGLVKYDILGLKNVGVIRKTCELIGIKYPLSHEIDWDDQEVFKDMITSPIGIFQFEGDYAFGLLKRFIQYRFDSGMKASIDDMSLVNASLRPSGESYRDRLLNGEVNKNPSKIIDDLLADNNGFLVYQEDTIKFLQQICGLSGSEADNVRRAIGRKQEDRLQKALPQILEGYCKMSPLPRSESEEEAKEFLKIIEDSSRYQFGYNHSTGYSMVGYLGAYLRYYDPLEFCTSYLNCAEKEEDIYEGTMLARQKGFSIKSPRFRVSNAEFSCDKETKTIYKGMKSIKDISAQNGVDLYELRNHSYNNFLELLDDIKGTSVKSNQLNILIKIDFFEEFGSIDYLLKCVVIYNSFKDKKQLKKDKAFELHIDFDLLRQCSEKETEKTFMQLDSEKLIRMLVSEVKNEPTPIKEKIQYQSELLGYIDIVDKKYSGYCVVTDINLDYSPKLSLYALANGNTIPVKIDKKTFSRKPLKRGDIVKVENQYKKPKMKKVDGKWVEGDEKEWWITEYRVV